MTLTRRGKDAFWQSEFPTARAAEETEWAPA